MGYKHIFLPEISIPLSYKARGGGGVKYAIRTSFSRHVQSLIDKYVAAFPETSSPHIGFGRNGVFLTFTLATDYKKLVNSLELERSGIQLRTVKTAGENLIANVFIPKEKRWLFLKRFERCKDQFDSGIQRPRNGPLLSGIEDIRAAVLDSFWQDSCDLMPGTDEPAWCEVWLHHGVESDNRGNDSSEYTDFTSAARQLNIEYSGRVLQFPERTIVLCKANKRQLQSLITSCSCVAEMRRVRETSQFFTAMPPHEQRDWVQDVLRRTVWDEDANKISVCVLDSGANNGHLLLRELLHDDCRVAANARWPLDDWCGHGTQMCGVAVYGNLADVLESSDRFVVSHVLESAKILPPGGNDKSLYGAVTQDGISRIEIAHPNRTRVLCMAVTETSANNKGIPSSWSATIDQLLADSVPDICRLMIVSAGNASWRGVSADAYPNNNIAKSIENPGQAWNALTVGAYTSLDRISDPTFAGYSPLAKAGELSPHSATSLTWDSQWPLKPDIVMEGGNMIVAPDGTVDNCDDVCLLTTSHQPSSRLFECFDGTSAAAGLASKMAAELYAEYPNAWPETIRGLLVHSARWTNEMMLQFCDGFSIGGGFSGVDKKQLAKLIRVCGHGVPDVSRALFCQKSYLTMIAESELHPYKIDGSVGKMNEMHLFELPWPREQLQSLGDIKVTLRVTLSYYIEPSPGERGWTGKYRYASHGLRFAVNSPLQTREDFITKINKAIEKEEDDEAPGLDSDRWVIGRKSDVAGSLHSDFMCESAQDIALCNLVAVYPVIGWWRERPKLGRVNNKARYSLIVSLETPETGVDIYTPVAVEVGVPVPVDIGGVG